MRIEASECEARILAKLDEGLPQAQGSTTSLTARQIVQACSDVLEDLAPGEAWQALVAFLAQAQRDEGRELIAWTLISQMSLAKAQDRQLPTQLPGPQQTWEALGLRLLVEIHPELAAEASALHTDEEQRATLAKYAAKLRWHNRNRIFNYVAHEIWTRRFDRMTERSKAWFLDELAKARAMFERALLPEHDNRFHWLGLDLWVDRPRMLIVDVRDIEGIPDEAWRARDTLPESEDPNSTAQDLLDIYGGEYQLFSAGALYKVFMRLLRGAELDFVLQQRDCVRMLNLVVAQPRFNPAFASLFWIAFGDELGPSGELYGPNFHETLRALMFAPAFLPERLPSLVEVRQAQIDFLERIYPGSTDETCAALSDEEWATRCERAMNEREPFMAKRCWGLIAYWAQAIHEPGLRDLP